MDPSTAVSRSGFVAVLGRPNVGKSTFLNKVLGTKLSAVTPRPQTTRNRILGIHEVPGAQLVFIDTPGVHRPHSELNRTMVDAAWAALSDADAGVLLIEAFQPPADAPITIPGAVRALIERIAARQLPCILAINKIDLIVPAALLPIIDTYRTLYEFSAIVPICAQRGDGVDLIVQSLVPLVPEGPRLFPEDQLSDRAQRFFVAELIREQIFLQAREEVPYGCAVMVDRYEEPRHSGRRLEIDATIIAEEPGQKKILVGRGGSRIKALGIQSRLAIEQYLGQPIILKLFVKVRPGWSKNAQAVRELGWEP